MNRIVELSKIVNGQSLGASFNGDALPLAHQKLFSVSYKFSGLSGDAAGTLKLQKCNDGVSWEDIAGASQVVDDETTIGAFEVKDFAQLYIRVVWTRVAGTGKLDCFLVAK